MTQSFGSPAPRRDKIGPGAFIAVCGPSGAGKDSLLRSAAAMLRESAHVAFPSRVVTRPASDAEMHDTATDDEFERIEGQGGFAMCWRAHGLRYGLPVSIDDDISAGRCVVCNVSRSVIEELRARYARVLTVLVTAPPHVLAERLQSRGRGSDGILEDRMSRSASIDSALDADVVIDNAGPLEDGARTLYDAIGSQLSGSASQKAI